MKILIADPTDAAARDRFKENNFDFDYIPDITSDDLLSKVDTYEGLLVRSRTKVTQSVIGKATRLKVVARIGSGFDNIDIASCKKKKITVLNAPDANSIAVAELTVCLMIAALRQIPRAIESMRKGEWLKNELWGHELGSQTIGIIGYGYVGTKVDRLVSAFGAKTLIYSRSYQTATLPEIFEKSDIVSVHLALTPETKGLVGRKLFELMKPSAIFINISRGQIIDEEALFSILEGKKIAYGILDVFPHEPLAPDSRWRKLSNVILTPHIGAATREALAKASMTVVEDTMAVLRGDKPKYKIV
ncbi:hydroxyacid dehydrogenase [Patescibacteria group bacterium]|nr:hydroxyacid dehydrogenase [Patescibacteria group bacterium]MCL5798396.1 hydroxyacid dehydrogenase [Patescibacteria group bacterium]